MNKLIPTEVAKNSRVMTKRAFRDPDNRVRMCEVCLGRAFRDPDNRVRMCEVCLGRGGEGGGA